jgi:hypothetical protein
MLEWAKSITRKGLHPVVDLSRQVLKKRRLPVQSVHAAWLRHACRGTPRYPRRYSDQAGPFGTIFLGDHLRHCAKHRASPRTKNAAQARGGLRNRPVILTSKTRAGTACPARPRVGWHQVRYHPRNWWGSINWPRDWGTRLRRHGQAEPANSRAPDPHAKDSPIRGTMPCASSTQSSDTFSRQTSMESSA